MFSLKEFTSSEWCQNRTWSSPNLGKDRLLVVNKNTFRPGVVAQYRKSASFNAGYGDSYFSRPHKKTLGTNDAGDSNKMLRFAGFWIALPDIVSDNSLLRKDKLQVFKFLKNKVKKKKSKINFADWKKSFIFVKQKQKC